MTRLPAKNIKETSKMEDKYGSPVKVCGLGIDLH